jgi:predicted ArsR family transcriptional regulator
MSQHYPDEPGYKRSGTSEAAAVSMSSDAATLRELVYDRLTSPMTADEMATALDRDKLSIRPRFSELSKRERIEDSGLRRRNDSGKNAIVWRRKIVIETQGPLF